jgi:hypothetical protein
MISHRAYVRGAGDEAEPDEGDHRPLVLSCRSYSSSQAHGVNTPYQPSRDMTTTSGLQVKATSSKNEADDESEVEVFQYWSDEDEKASGSRDSSDLGQSDIADRTWPATDVFMDDACHGFSRCSELGSERIRLVRIRPGPSCTTLECEIKICFLNQAEDYIALSYAWGNLSASHPVIVDAQPRLLTTNLWRFLWQAREMPERFSGWLWIDALSIDQSDPWEKLEQVKIISDIFRSAEETVSWLGPAYGDSDRAMKLLDTLSLKPPSWRMSRSIWAPPTGPAVLELCERPYWRRLWVLQELRASTKLTLMCGTMHINFESLKIFLLKKNIDERVQDKANTLEQSSGARMVRLTLKSMSVSLRSMLDLTSHLRCTDPRDKVYAILSVVSSGRQDIEADYTLAINDVPNAVLRNMCKTGIPDLKWVRDQCDLLECMFGVTWGSMCYVEENSGPTRDHYHQPLWTFNWVGRDVSGRRAKDQADLLTILYIWCKRYDHKEISQHLYRHSRINLKLLRRERNSALRPILEALRDL